MAIGNTRSKATLLLFTDWATSGMKIMCWCRQRSKIPSEGFGLGLNRGCLRRSPAGKLKMKNLPFASLTCIFVFSCPHSGKPGSLNWEQKSPLSWGGFSFCGERGIRTPGTLLRYTRFPGVPVKPLLHLSWIFKIAAQNTKFFRMKRVNLRHLSGTIMDILDWSPSLLGEGREGGW